MAETADPRELLRAVRDAQREATEADFTTPDWHDDEPGYIAVPAPGVVHAAHVAWVAECLGQSSEWVLRVLAEGTSEDACGPRVIADALATCGGSGRERLEALGVDPRELLLLRVPLPPARTRPNPSAPGANPILSTMNAALQMFQREAASIHRLVELGAPDVITDLRANQLQRSFLALVHLLEKGTLLFEPHEEPLTDPPTPTSLVIPPPEPADEDGPLRPIAVAMSGPTVILQSSRAIACIDTRTGEATAHALGDAVLISIRDGQALFTHGAHLVVFDMARRAFALEPPSLPRRVVIGACCGITVLDTESRRVATLPGPIADSPFGVTISGCGRYGWVDLAPSLDDVGVFSIEELERVFQPWPHPSLGVPEPAGSGADEDETQGHDDTVRAIARCADGTFRILYGDTLLFGATVHRLPDPPDAACFDAEGEQLVTSHDHELHIHRLDGDAAPHLVSRWSFRTNEDAHPILERLEA